MSLAEQMPLAEVKNRLSAVVERVEREHDRVVITKHGRPAAVVVSGGDLESLDALDVLHRRALLADIHEALAPPQTRLSERLTRAQALDLLRER